MATVGINLKAVCRPYQTGVIVDQSVVQDPNRGADVLDSIQAIATEGFRALSDPELPRETLLDGLSVSFMRHDGTRTLMSTDIETHQTKSCVPQGIRSLAHLSRGNL